MFIKRITDYSFAASSPRHFLISRAASFISDVLFVMAVFALWAAASYGVTLFRYINGAAF